MNVQRAQEIVASPEMIAVTYDGTPVYIQHVNTHDDTARIFPIGMPEREQNVSIANLVEHSM